jgi:hypothetical protein
VLCVEICGSVFPSVKHGADVVGVVVLMTFNERPAIEAVLRGNES